MTKQELKDYLVEEAEWPESKVNEMDSYELLNHWLTYNGIIGYTQDILSVINAAYGTKLQ